MHVDNGFVLLMGRCLIVLDLTLVMRESFIVGSSAVFNPAAVNRLTRPPAAFVHFERSFHCISPYKRFIAFHPPTGHHTPYSSRIGLNRTMICWREWASVGVRCIQKRRRRRSHLAVIAGCDLGR